MNYGIYNVTLSKWVIDDDTDDGLQPFTANNRPAAEAAMARVRELARLNPKYFACVFEVRPYRAGKLLKRP